MLFRYVWLVKAVADLLTFENQLFFVLLIHTVVLIVSSNKHILFKTNGNADLDVNISGNH